MTFRKFIMGATVCTLALTVPTNVVFAGCGCPKNDCKKPCKSESPCKKKEKPCKKKEDPCKEEKNPCTSGCPVKKHSAAVTPDTATCKRCHKPADSCACACEGGMVTGAAAPVKEENRYRQQIYAYPADVYNNAANTAMVGSDERGVLLGDQKSCQQPGGILLEEGGLTGAAATIDDTRMIDEIVGSKKERCAAESTGGVRVESPTSIEMTRRYLENYDMKGMTGGAAGMRAFYPDVPDSFWASPEINRLTDKCVLVGYPDGLFRPTRPVSRAEMATAVVKGYNLADTALSSSGDFIDVPRSHWAYEMINKGAASDFLEGHANGKYDPNGHITMAQALTIVSKGINCPMDNEKANQILSQYADGASVPSWARLSVAKAIDNGALGHSKGGRYIHPNKNASRAEIATMLQAIRIAGGYDTENKIVENKNIKSFVEKEERMQIPTLELKMQDIINSKNANVGDQFAAKTVNEIIIDGKVYPAGSRVNGKIAEVVRPTGDCEGALRLSFNEIVDECHNKVMLPKQVLTASVDKTEQVNGFARLVELPFTWTGAVVGNVGRTAGGMVIGAANAFENVMDGTGTGTAELLTGKFRAAGRSYQDAAKALIVAPVDFTRTALSGVIGTFQTSADEIAYLVDPNGNKISQINPKQKLTIAFGESDW